MKTVLTDGNEVEKHMKRYCSEKAKFIWHFEYVVHGVKRNKESTNEYYQ